MGSSVSWRSVPHHYWILVLTICIVGIFIVLPGGAQADDSAEDAALVPAALGYSTYLGGSSDEQCLDLKQIDGKVIVTGYTKSIDFPATLGAYDITVSNYDVFVTELNSSGSNLILSTFLGGSGHDFGEGVSVDDRGYIYVTGSTESYDFPTVGGSFDTTKNDLVDAFALVLLPDGSNIYYSTFLGGMGNETGYAIEVASGYRAVIVGATGSSDFPTLGSWDKTLDGFSDGFITALNADGSAIVKSTYFGGSHNELVYDLIISPLDDVCITGQTWSSDFPLTRGAFDKTLNGGKDGFLFCMNPFTQVLLGSTYFGGSGHDWGFSIAMGNDPNYMYVTGKTASTDFPTLNAYDGTFNGGGSDAFVAKFSYNGDDLYYSTYLGGSDSEAGQGISVDSQGYIYITGNTYSTDFPVTAGALDVTHNGDSDVFFSMLKFGHGTYLYDSTFLGGTLSDSGHAIDIRGSYEVFIAGRTESADFPTTKYAFDTTFNGGSGDGFVCKLNFPPPDVDFDLCQGLNLISYPYNDSFITNADSFLDSICPGNADSIWKYDCSTRKFVSWTTLDPGDGWAVSPGLPVWVNVTNPVGCTWVPSGLPHTKISYNTCVGLNLVTVPEYTQSINMASQLLADIPGCTAIYRYKKEVSCKNPGGFDGYFNISPPYDDFPLMRGHGYWASTTTASTWTPPNP